MVDNESAIKNVLDLPLRLKHSMAIILSGGKGERLFPLTLHRAKPAVPFGGHYRIIDFTLSNCVNSSIRKIALLTQYKSLSLDRHIRQAWSIFNAELGEFVITIPPQQRVGEKWYEGTADAVYQNIYVIANEDPAYLFILSGDHIYKMDYSEMLAYHLMKGADCTLAAIEVKKEEATRFGVLQVDEDSRIIGFQEKPEKPQTIPGNPEYCYVSMGVYLFNTGSLIEELRADAMKDTEHDFGKNIIPAMIESKNVYAFSFVDKNKKEVKYWRDIGTLDSYWDANMDLCAVDPLFDLYDPEWPIRSYHGQHPPAKFVFAQEFKGGRLGIALDSIVSNGCIISGGRVQNSVLSPRVRVNSYADVRESILLENVNIGRHCKIKKAIIDKEVSIPEGMTIGYDHEEDKKKFKVTDGGVVVVPKGITFD
ncbi:MAG: glucose-1-phosphate adenylyltransferase [Nitrospirae bacterium]|nr:MAG: glucose-1-phosphate adenylyltransferase [Nitrospirota bacterium]